TSRRGDRRPRRGANRLPASPATPATTIGDGHAKRSPVHLGELLRLKGGHAATADACPALGATPAEAPHRSSIAANLRRPNAVSPHLAAWRPQTAPRCEPTPRLPSNPRDPDRRQARQTITSSPRRTPQAQG